MNERKFPSFAVLGHPNEGKSSVVSTLAEDDSVPISPTPGETRSCREYPVIIDGRPIIRFVDTPGFQRPRDTLKWMENYGGPEAGLLPEFIRTHRNDENFSDECELLTPLANGAGIIFVVDGSRPVRGTDRMEMEILRRTGLPRMAVINLKDSGTAGYIEDWKAESRRHFNSIRIFDAHRASFAERIDLLESLKRIDPDWQPALDNVITAFRADWRERLEETARIIADLMREVLEYHVRKNSPDIDRIDQTRSELMETYQSQLTRIEKQAQERLRKRFKHNIFSYELPPQSIVKSDLFDRKTWQALGLTRQQMAWAGAGIGAGIGAKIEAVLGGAGLGAFMALGGAIGAGSAILGTKKVAQSKVLGQSLGGVQIQVGPVENDQLLFVMIDRALIYFSYVINWAHSRREKAETESLGQIDISRHLSAQWGEDTKRTTLQFFQAVRRGDPTELVPAAGAFRTKLVLVLQDLSNFKG